MAINGLVNNSNSNSTTYLGPSLEWDVQPATLPGRARRVLYTEYTCTLLLSIVRTPTTSWSPPDPLILFLMMCLSLVGGERIRQKKQSVSMYFSTSSLTFIAWMPHRSSTKQTGVPWNFNLHVSNLIVVETVSLWRVEAFDALKSSLWKYDLHATAQMSFANKMS